MMRNPRNSSSLSSVMEDLALSRQRQSSSTYRVRQQKWEKTQKEVQLHTEVKRVQVWHNVLNKSCVLHCQVTISQTTRPPSQQPSRVQSGIGGKCLNQVALGHQPPGLDDGLLHLYTAMGGPTGLGLNNAPNRVVKGIEVRAARRPNILGPEL